MNDVIKIANCSGFYGDKLSAALEMVEGGPIDVLTGDYLAELTMAILHGQKLKKSARGDDTGGYVGTFLKQVKQVLKPCNENGIKIVSNAGGLNPAAMADAVKEIAKELNLINITSGAGATPIKMTVMASLPFTTKNAALKIQHGRF